MYITGLAPVGFLFMFGLFKPEKALYVTKGELKLAVDALEDEILAVSDRVALRNRHDGIEVARSKRAEQALPLDETQQVAIIQGLKNMGLSQQQIAGAEVVLKSGIVTPSLINQVIKGLVR